MPMQSCIGIFCLSFAKNVAVVAVPMVAKVADRLPVPPAVKQAVKVVNQAVKIIKK